MPTISEQIKTLAVEQKRAWETEGKPLADIASEREFTADEREKFEQLERAYNGFDDRITVLSHQRDMEERALRFADDMVGSLQPGESLAENIRSVLRGESRNYDYAPTAQEVRASALAREEHRALSVGGTPNIVGKTYLDRLIEPLRQFSAVYAAGAYTFVTEKGDDVTVPRLSAFGAAASQSESTQLTGTDPAFNQVTFKAYKYGDFRGVSTELVADSLIDIEGLTTRLMGDNISVLLGQKLAVGAGTTEPTGIATAATTGVTGGTGVVGAPSWDNLIDLQESVIAPYQANASWIASNSAVAAIRKLKDSQNRYLWEPNGQSGAPSELLGNPVRRDPFVAPVGLGAKSLFYGDFTRYWIRIVGSVRIERSDHALFGSDQVAFRAVLRADGNLTDVSAVKAFVGGAA